MRISYLSIFLIQLKFSFLVVAPFKCHISMRAVFTKSLALHHMAPATAARPHQQSTRKFPNFLIGLKGSFGRVPNDVAAKLLEAFIDNAKEFIKILSIYFSCQTLQLLCFFFRETHILTF